MHRAITNSCLMEDLEQKTNTWIRHWTSGRAGVRPARYSSN